MTFDHQQPPLVFGEALFDCFPDGAEVLGGAPFNVAWHLAAFGLEPVFLSRVGEDALGERIDAAMREQGMTTLGLQRDPVHATGTVQVLLAGGEPSYEILPDRAYDHIDAAALPPLPERALLYHGSLALRQSVSADALRMLRGRLSPAVFLDVNLRDPWWQKDTLIELLNGATWVKLNADELALLAPEAEDVEARAQRLRERYELETVFATLGAEGAFAVAADGAVSRVAPAGDIQMVDAVGAGDGFASVLILGLIRHWPLPQTLERAQTFASAIVGLRGATVRDPGFYEPFLSDWGLSGA
ncbi:PfkB family carbohydrate kinase [Halochromatium sp.]